MDPVRLNLNQIVRISTGGVETYAIVVTHIFQHRLGFKGLLDLESPFSISTDQLKHYCVEIVGVAGSDEHIRILAKMKEDELCHKRIWALFNAEGRYNLDLPLVDLYARGVVTNYSPGILDLASRN